MIFFATNKLSDEAAAFLKFAFILYSFNYYCFSLDKGFGVLFSGTNWNFQSP